MKKLLKYVSGLVVAIACVICLSNFANADVTDDGIQYSISGNYVNITGYTGSATNVTIPSTIDGKSVKYIGSQSFSNCTEIVSVTIPESVTEIRQSAFSGCTSLESIHLPEGLTTLSSFAFSGCTSLKSIDIPDEITTIMLGVFYECEGLEKATLPSKLTTIKDQAFDGCVSLKSLDIPSGVTSISRTAFYDCCGIESITISSDNTVYNSNNSCNAIIETASNTLLVGCKNTIIPNGVTSIGINAFRNCEGLISIEIPDGVTSIGDFAFNWCENLRAIKIPESVTEIGSDVFNKCSKVKIYTTEGSTADTYASSNRLKVSYSAMPEEIESSGVTYSYLPVEENGVKYADDVVVTSTDIRKTEITVPEKLGECTVRSIGSDDTQFITNSQLSIRVSSFDVIIENAEVINANAFKDNFKLSNITIPEGVTTIGDSAFYGATSLSNVTIPNSVTNIGNNAFSGATSCNVNILNANTEIEGTDKWGVNCIIGYENSTAKDFANTSEDSFYSLNEWYETSDYDSATFAFNVGYAGDEELNAADVIKGYDESNPLYVTKYYATAGFKLPNLTAVPAYKHYEFKGYAINNELIYDNEGKVVVSDVDALNKAAGNDYFEVKDGSLYTTSLVSDMEFTAVWEADTYTVEFSSNEEYALYEKPTGTMEPQTFSYNEKKALNLNQFKQTGYNFKRWSTNKAGTGEVYEDGKEVKNLLGDNWEDGDTITLYAQWEPREVTIPLILPEGISLPHAIYSTYKYIFDPEGKTTYKLPTSEDIYLKGYTLKYWENLDNNKIYTEFTSDNPYDFTLTPYFELNKHNLYVDGELIFEFEYSADRAIIKPSSLEPKEHYHIAGYTSEDEDVVITQPENTNSWTFNRDTDRDVYLTTLFAEDEFDVNYTLNGGTPTEELVRKRAYSQTITLPTVTKEGYTFDGWFIGNNKVEVLEGYTTKTYEVSAEFTKIPTETVTPTETSNPTETVTPTESANPSENQTPDGSTTPTDSNTNGTSETNSVGNATPAPTAAQSNVASGAASAASGTATTQTTATQQTTNTSNIKVNIKNNKSYKVTKKVVIKAANGIKVVKLNGKKLKAKKGAKKYTFKFKKFKKFLKKNGKKNKLLIKDIAGEKIVVKFNVK